MSIIINEHALLQGQNTADTALLARVKICKIGSYSLT